jgi:UDP-galactopyranose mutase
MAGSGTRTANEFDHPKPLIPVQGRPLFSWALEGLPLHKAIDLTIITSEEVANYQNFNSTLVYEYPLDHDYKTTIPFYPINSEENSKIHKEYVEITNRKFPKMYLSGRLADYKYFNMDQVIAKSLTLFDSLNK